MADCRYDVEHLGADNRQSLGPWLSSRATGVFARLCWVGSNASVGVANAQCIFPN